jgi:ribosomal protein S21
VDNQPAITRLPFKTAPEISYREIGTEKTGILVFPVYSDLTVNESAWLAQNTAEQNAFSYTSKIALKIANIEGIKPLDAHHFVAKVLAKAMGAVAELTDKEENMTVKYVKELEQTAMKVVEISLAQQNLIVTALIRHRLAGMNDWTIHDTAGLPNDLVEAIFLFAQQEKNHGVPQTMEETNNEMEDALKKLKREAGKSPSSRTGKKSITSSKRSTPVAKTTATTTSDSSQSTQP